MTQNLTPEVDKKQAKKNELAQHAAHYLLQNGFEGFTLRLIGQAANTSDRMLLHYFANKNELLQAALLAAQQNLFAYLEQTQLTRQEPAGMMMQLHQLILKDAFLPYLRLWLALLVYSQKQTGFKAIAAQMLHAFEQWIAPKIECPAEQLEQCSAFVVTWLEGAVVRQLAGQSDAIGLEWFGNAGQYQLKQ